MKKSIPPVSTTVVSADENYPLHVPFGLTKDTLIVDTLIEELLLLQDFPGDAVFFEKTLKKFNTLLKSSSIDSIVCISEHWKQRVKQLNLEKVSLWASCQLPVIEEAIKDSLLVDTVIEEISHDALHDKVFLEKTLEKFSAVLNKSSTKYVVSIAKYWEERVKQITLGQKLSSWTQNQLQVIDDAIKSVLRSKNVHIKGVKKYVLVREKRHL
jgi:hypothetical protein